MSNGALGTESAQELGPELDPDRRQPGARGEADAAGLVVETKAVLPPPMRCEPKRERTQLEGDGQRNLIGKETGVLETGQEGFRQIGVSGEVESVDAGSKFPHAVRS